MADLAKTAGMFFITACAEIIGCYLPYLYVHSAASVWVLLPAGISLAVFAWLLTLHPSAAGRTYSAYGGVYVATALLWLWAVEGQRPDAWDLIGASISIAGMGIILFAPRSG